MMKYIKYIGFILLIVCFSPVVSHGMTNNDILIELNYPMTDTLIKSPVLEVYQLSEEEYNEAKIKKVDTDLDEAVHFIDQYQPEMFSEINVIEEKTEFYLPRLNSNTLKESYYLIFQRSNSLSTTMLEGRLFPLLITPEQLESTHVVIEGKITSMTSDIYLFKVDEKHQPLSNASFVLSRKTGAGLQEYYTPTGWVSEKKDAYHFQSMSNGILRISSATLENGNYVLEEVKAPAGYDLTPESKNINIQITSDQTNVQSKHIAINNVTLSQFQANKLPNKVLDKLEPSVVNKKNNERPKVSKGKLPQTNEQKTIIALMGAMLLSLSLIVYINKKRGLEDE